jgi:hypothetical protein
MLFTHCQRLAALFWEELVESVIPWIVVMRILSQQPLCGYAYHVDCGLFAIQL